VARVLPDDVDSRLNDAAVDPAGRFLVGSMALDGRQGEEVLVRLDPAGCTTIDADLTLSNGLGWSPAGDRFYSTDTVARVVWVRDYDPTTGVTGPRREVFRTGDGFPDGLCVDVDGNLWVAIWGRGRVECRTPTGEVLATVAVDAPHTSSVAFAGPDLDVLVITTATDSLTPEKLARHPDSGRLFTARVGAVGLPTAYWKP
jgi:sugar lactone lactonase YvrE